METLGKQKNKIKTATEVQYVTKQHKNKNESEF